MAAPKVNLRQRNDKKGTSYFVDFTLNGKRYRIAAGNNKKKAESIRREFDARLLLGQLNLFIKKKIIRIT